MSQNVVIEDYIFPTGKATPIDVSPFNIGLKVPPLRSVSTNSAENQEHKNEKNYDRPIAPSNNIYDNLDFEKKESSFFKNRKNLIIFSSILFVVAIVVIIAVIMIVLATASK
jgi:hypothetical protein